MSTPTPDAVPVARCVVCGRGWQAHSMGGSSAKCPGHPVEVSAVAQHVEQIIVAVLAEHRRELQARACTGCVWLAPAGTRQTGDPEATRRRHDAFNAHLARHVADRL